ncbi:MAG: AMP-binding protein [Pseudomonadota bacterium]
MTEAVGTLEALSRDDVRRVLAALLRDVVRRRHGSVMAGRLWRLDFNDETLLGEDGVGLDSLALIAACSRVGSFFGLGQLGLDDYLLLGQRLGDWVDLVHDARAHITEIEFQTSGTTGTAKKVRHSVSALWEEASLRSLLPGCGIVLSTVPCCHAYGFIFSVLAVRQRQRTVIEAQPASTAPILWREHGIDTVLAVPELLQDERIKGIFHDSTRERALTIVCSGSPLHDDAWARFSSKGNGLLIDVYGASESLGIGRRFGSGAYELLPHRRWSSDNSSRIEDHSGIPLPVQDLLIRYGKEFFLGPRLDGKINRAGLLIDIDDARKRVHSVGAKAEICCDLISVDGGDELLLRVCPPALTDGQGLPQRDLDERIRTVINALPPEARPTRVELG